MTQDDLIKKMGKKNGKPALTQSMVSQILTGRKRPRWPMAKKLAMVVPGTTVEMWMEGEPENLRTALKEA